MIHVLTVASAMIVGIIVLKSAKVSYKMMVHVCFYRVYRKQRIWGWYLVLKRYASTLDHNTEALVLPNVMLMTMIY